MSQNKKDVNDPGRREFVRWSVQLSAGIALAPLAGCGGGGDGPFAGMRNGDGGARRAGRSGAGQQSVSMAAKADGPWVCLE